MIHRTPIDRAHQLIFRIDERHIIVIRDRGWIGVNIHAVTDLDLLIEWWNKTLYHGGKVETAWAIRDKELTPFFAALWVRINELHPKMLLRFSDIARPELFKVKKAA